MIKESNDILKKNHSLSKSMKRYIGITIAIILFLIVAFEIFKLDSKAYFMNMNENVIYEDLEYTTINQRNNLNKNLSEVNQKVGQINIKQVRIDFYIE